MKKILVTGAGGYIGSVAASLLLQKGYEVVAIDNFCTGFKQPLIFLQQTYGEQRLRYYNMNISQDLSPLFAKEPNIKAVLHYAAHCSVNESMEKPEIYFGNNTCATNSFVTQLLNQDIKTLVFSSTCAVYGEAEHVPIDETHTTRPTNPYGESKRMSEKMIQWYGNQHRLKYMILRYFNVCGATDEGKIGDSKKPSVHLMQNAVRGALGLEPFFLTCGTFDTPDGTPIRDYLNVVDLNEAHILALEHLLGGGSSEIINLGTGDGNSVLEIVQAVQDITGYELKLEHAESRKGEYAKMVASIEKAEKVLGWKPKRTLKQSVETLVKWYKAHPKGWEK